MLALETHFFLDLSRLSMNPSWNRGGEGIQAEQLLGLCGRRSGEGLAPPPLFLVIPQPLGAQPSEGKGCRLAPAPRFHPSQMPQGDGGVWLEGDRYSPYPWGAHSLRLGSRERPHCHSSLWGEWEWE